jgi:hypothetical protein
MTWGSAAREASEKAAKSGLFVKLEAKGDAVTVVFLSEPLTYDDNFEGKVTSKILFEVYDVEQGARRILDINAKHVAKAGWFKEIDDIGIDHQYKITRTGVGVDTAFDLRAKAKGEVGPALKGAIKASEPLDLGEIVAKKTKGAQKGPSAYDRVDEIPVADAEEAERLRRAEMDENIPVR